MYFREKKISSPYIANLLYRKLWQEYNQHFWIERLLRFTHNFLSFKQPMSIYDYICIPDKLAFFARKDLLYDNLKGLNYDLNDRPRHKEYIAKTEPLRETCTINGVVYFGRNFRDDTMRMCLEQWMPLIGSEILKNIGENSYVGIIDNTFEHDIIDIRYDAWHATCEFSFEHQQLIERQSYRKEPFYVSSKYFQTPSKSEVIGGRGYYYS